MYNQLVKSGKVVPQPEKEPPTVPMDYKWAQELGLIRKPASVMSSICDERGEELLYAGMPISDVFKVYCVCTSVFLDTHTLSSSVGGCGCTYSIDVVTYMLCTCVCAV